jgi:hypothetical protein
MAYVYNRYSGYDILSVAWDDIIKEAFSNRCERLSEMVQENNALLERLVVNGAVSPGCGECDSNYGDDYYDDECDVDDDDEPDYLDLIRSVARGAAT